MFNHIIVSQELLPIRKAASKGSLDAMLQLAEAAAFGNGTKRCGDTAYEILMAMIDEDEIKKDIHRFCNVFVLIVYAFEDQYEKGQINLSEYAYYGCTYLSMAVDLMTKLPYQFWRIGQLHSCLNWIAENMGLIEEGEYA